MKFLVANWKANPDSPGRAVRIAREIESAARRARSIAAVIAPPFPFLLSVQRVIKKASLGAQDMFWEGVGPYTGEVSWHQLKRLRVSYVIIGHSERRRWLNETDEMINKKVKAALKAGLKVILCVGEPIEVRRKGLTAAKHFVANQLQKDLRDANKLISQKANKLAVAYEPIWAIGTGRADKPKDTVAMAKFVKEFLASRFYFLDSKILYGGSVTSRNAASFLKHKEIDGALIGGASLSGKEFGKIIKIANAI